MSSINNNYDILFPIDNLDTNYLEGLRERIPILQNNLLLQLILNYCIKFANNKDVSSILNKINKLIYFIGNSQRHPLNITPINTRINIESNIFFELDPSINGTTFIKGHPLNAAAIIEAIIEYTLHGYNKLSCPALISMEISNLTNNHHNTRKRFIQRMEIISNNEYITFGNYIKELFNNLYRTYEQKIEELRNILIAIANKINYLYINYGFIHGDFHSGNIYINPTNGEVRIIDFGYSCIKLPLNNENLSDFLLCVPVSAYKTNNLLKFPYNDSLKKIDLFHLIYELSTSDIPLLNRFINNIFKFSGNKNIKEELNKIKEKHKFICSNKLFEISDFFVPDQFIIKINDVPIEIEQNERRNFSANSRSNRKNTHRRRIFNENNNMFGRFAN